MNNSFSHKIQDFIAIIRGAWFLLLFNGIAFAAFLLISQGRDVLLLVTENTADHPLNAQFIALLTALFFWCISAEFATRLLIYLTDNSGHSLDPIRVQNRKDYQLFASRAALFYPVILMFLAFIKVYLNNHSDPSTPVTEQQLPQINKGTLIILIALIAEFGLLWWLYPGELINKASKKFSWLKWIAISPQEKQWVDKLYGILNDVRVDVPNLALGKASIKPGVLLPNGMTLPNSQYFVLAPKSPLRLAKTKINVWIFQIKLGFYKCLIRQQGILLFFAIVIILLFGFIAPVSWEIKIGAAGIICFAFGAWQSVYVFLHFLDKAQPVPVRFVLFVWMIVVSIINEDHPVRILAGNGGTKISLQAHFDKWLDSAKNSRDGDKFYRIGQQDSIPVIFVSAEGGALRTGAFTGLLLAKLQDRFPLFRNYLYGYSSVSGGTLGSNFFNAQLLRNRHKILPGSAWYEPSKEFFKTDFLSAPTAKLAFGEIIGYFWPQHISRADRAIALEESFEEGWTNAYAKGENLMAASFNKTIDPGLPALFINTTEAETGLQNVWSNVLLDSIPKTEFRDLRVLQNEELRYSSAINLSDRFPLVSPGASFKRHFRGHDGKDSVARRHFVDGGYYENKGSATLLQVLKALQLEGKPVKPYILQFNFSGDTVVHSITKFNEISEIIAGIYNTRGGRGRMEQDALMKYVESLHGEFIPLNLNINEKKLPLNWVLSATAVNRLYRTVDDLVYLRDRPTAMDSSAKGQLQRLFFYDNCNLRSKNSTISINNGCNLPGIEATKSTKTAKPIEKK